jgi:glycosyltransferase involved in cell wall biosynthesis
MRPLSVAVVAACPFPYSRGTPIRIHRLSNAIAEQGVQVHVITYHLGQPADDAVYQVTRIPRIRTYNRYNPGPSYQKLLVVDPVLAVTLRRLLTRCSFDLIHAHHYEGLAVALAARNPRRHPIVYDAHTTLESELPYYRLGISQTFKRALGRQLDHWLPRRADHVITVTERISQRLVREARIPEERITVISNGVEMEPFLNTRRPERENRASVNTVIFSGNLANYQGIELLLHAFRLVVETRPDARLLIVSGSSFSNYRNLVSELGIGNNIDVHDADFSELPALLASADVAVNPRTDCDGIPQKLLNYMAAGLPIVSFAGSAVSLDHGETGWVVENGDIPGFARGIIHLLTDAALAGRLGRNARAAGRLEYSWDRSAEKAISVYEQVLDRRLALADY